jgi:hypothetical protein
MYNFVCKLFLLQLQKKSYIFVECSMYTIEVIIGMNFEFELFRCYYI